jgi:hypothetical protein
MVSYIIQRMDLIMYIASSPFPAFYSQSPRSMKMSCHHVVYRIHVLTNSSFSCSFISFRASSTNHMHTSSTSRPTRQEPSTTPSRSKISLARSHRRLHSSSRLFGNGGEGTYSPTLSESLFVLAVLLLWRAGVEAEVFTKFAGPDDQFRRSDAY